MRWFVLHAMIYINDLLIDLMIDWFNDYDFY